MANILAKSPAESEQIKRLLKKNLPSYRQAYSDRTAWLMACLSELAYIRFNPSTLTDKHKEFIQDNILKSLKEGKTKTALLKMISLIVDYDPEEEKKKLADNAEVLEMKVMALFDCNGTQAILTSNDNFIALAFRGTEATSIKDIKANMKVKTTQCETGGKIHIGFNEAFNEVAWDINKKLSESTFQDKPLFITGHSLGGALATIAAKKLSHKGGIAACYTFGAPRVGDEEWIADIKTPIYRLVNAADCVTMLPTGNETVTCLAWAARGISWLGVPFLSQGAESFSKWLLATFGGYLHCGNMRYMTNCKSGDYSNVKLLYSVSFFYRIKGWLIKNFSGGKFLSDHSISTYRKKLMIIAERRNQTD